MKFLDKLVDSDLEKNYAGKSLIKGFVLFLVFFLFAKNLQRF